MPKPLCTALAVACLAASTACRPWQDPREEAPAVTVDFSKEIESAGGQRGAAEVRPLRIAVAAMTSPAETRRFYQQMLDYIGRKLGIPIRLVQRKTYQEVNDLLERGELEAAFLCSGGYVQARGNAAPELLAVPVIRGKTTYQAYIIAHERSPFRDFTGLRGRSFAFTDPLSNTGWLFPVAKLAEAGTTPSSYFSRTIYTYGHDRSVEAVRKQIVDAASVDSLIYDYFADTAPAKVKDTRIILRSPEFGIPPLVARPGLERSTKQRMAMLLKSMHRDGEGKQILRNLLIDSFTDADPRAYDSIREMARRVGAWRPWEDAGRR